MLIESEEIYLRDYFKILIENKLLISVIFLIFLIIGFIFSFLFSQIYEVDTWLEIGKVNNVFIEEPNQIIRKIREGIYGEYEYKMEAIIANKTNLIKVKIKSENPEKAKKILSALNSRILLEHNALASQERRFIEDKINSAEEEMKLWNESKKKIDVGSSDPVYRLSSLLIELEIENKQNDIKALKYSLLNIIDTKIIKEPSILSDSQLRKFLLNSAIFGFIGLFCGIFLVFLRKAII